MNGAGTGAGSGTGRFPRRLGLTGSIGAGKSTVAGLLREAGLRVVDADALARAVTQQPDVLALLEARWPGVVAGGRLDRAALAARVFGEGTDPAGRRALEAIVHPRVRAATEAEVAAAAQAGEAWVVHDVPLLFENGLDAGMDCVWVVDAPLELRLERVQRRSGLTPEQALAREQAQLPAAEKRARAGRVIDNGGTLDELRAAVQAALAALPA